MVARRGTPAVSEGQDPPDHRGWRRQQRLPSPSVEDGATEAGGRGKPLPHGVPLYSWGQQVEQGGAPLVLLHLIGLARRAASRLRDNRGPDRQDDHRQGAQGDMPTRPPLLSRRTQGV